MLRGLIKYNQRHIVEARRKNAGCAPVCASCEMARMSQNRSPLVLRNKLPIYQGRARLFVSAQHRDSWIRYGPCPQPYRPDQPDRNGRHRAARHTGGDSAASMYQALCFNFSRSLGTFPRASVAGWDRIDASRRSPACRHPQGPLRSHSADNSLLQIRSKAPRPRSIDAG
jgi:hypothetical protein